MATDLPHDRPVRGTLEPLDPPGRAALARFWRDQRIGLVLLLVAVGALVVVVAALGERIAYRGDVLPGVRVAGVDLGRQSEREALTAIQRLGQRLTHRTLHAHAGQHDLSLDPVAIGYHVDAAATVRAARREGRSASPLDTLTGVLARALRPDEIPVVYRWDRARLAAVLDTWVGETGRGLVDGGLRFDGAEVAEIRPRRGIGINRDDAEDRILQALGNGTSNLGELTIGPTTPAVEMADVRRVAARARRVLSRPVTVHAADTALTLTPEQVATTLRTQISESRLHLHVDEPALRLTLAPALAGVEHAPRDAAFAVDGANVSVVPAVAGVAVRLGPVASAIARGVHDTTAPIDASEPAHSTAWAQKLNITELVSSYTTQYPCCQPRVTNIQRAVATINGTVLQPGETFSLNTALGPRTTDKGYVLAPGIGANLEFEDSVGGGVSQVSTTLYNASFFGCYQDVTHTVHALYISRYPMGREATLNYPSIDNQFRNDSNAGVLIRASAGSTSITISLYGNKEGRSCRGEGPHVLQTIPVETTYVDDPTLPIGTEKQLAHGSTGYVVENFRIISRAGQPDKRERYVERYSMAKAKVARGTGPPPPTTTTTPAVTPPASTP